MKKAGMEEASIFPIVIIQSLSLQSAIKNIGPIKKGIIYLTPLEV
jgi:hypothetical protein